MSQPFLFLLCSPVLLFLAVVAEFSRQRQSTLPRMMRT